MAKTAEQKLLKLDTGVWGAPRFFERSYRSLFNQDQRADVNKKLVYGHVQLGCLITALKIRWHGISIIVLKDDEREAK